MADLPAPQSSPSGTPQRRRVGIVGGLPDAGQSLGGAFEGATDRGRDRQPDTAPGGVPGWMLDGASDGLPVWAAAGTPGGAARTPGEADQMLAGAASSVAPPGVPGRDGATWSAQATGQTAARSAAVLRRARDEYLARHGPAPDPPPRRWAVSRRLGLAAAGVVALVAVAVGLRAGTSVAGGAASGPVQLATPSPPAAVATATDNVVVHVVGAVTAPGIVTLPHGSRVADAIDAAGGPGDADLTGVNLARPLVDGEQLYVPRPGEVVPDTIAGAAPAAADDGLVDLNRASQAELEELPGVGPVLAGRIADARPFASVDELDQVSGIGPATMARLRDLVKV